MAIMYLRPSRSGFAGWLVCVYLVCCVASLYLQLASYSYSQECITKSRQLLLEMRLGIGHLLRHSNVYLCKL